jgi:hypothetical protein
MPDLPPDSQAKCDLALSYVQEMIAWYDEDMEDEPLAAYVRDVIDQVDKRTPLTDAERAWLEANVNVE